MLGTKMYTFLKVAEYLNFTKAAEALYMTQPAVSQQIKQLEEEVGAKVFIRNKNGLSLTQQGEIVLKYARRQKALYEKMQLEIQNAEKNAGPLRIGITHTAESNVTASALAKYSIENNGVKIMLTTDTINNLYDKLENYELDLAIIDASSNNPKFSSMLLDTDYLMCVLSPDNPLSQRSAVTISELKKEKMILRSSESATRKLFEETLVYHGEDISSFDVILEVDNIATIKDLIRKDLGVSIIPRSACLDEIRKGKIKALPIENFSMVRETRIVYNKDFRHKEVLDDIIRIYGKTASV